MKDANENPWYVLMTLYGEQEGDRFDSELHEKNKHLWAAWALQDFNNSDFSDNRENDVRIPKPEPWEFAKVKVEAALKKRHPTLTMDQLPDPSAPYDLEKLNFPKPLNLHQFVLLKALRLAGSRLRGGFSISQAHCLEECSLADCIFDGHVSAVQAKFLGWMSMNDAVFKGKVTFHGAHFSKDIEMLSVHFRDDAQFNSVSCAGEARILSSYFDGIAEFGQCEFEVVSFSRSHFKDVANFQFAIFLNIALFNSVRFDAAVDFSYFTVGEVRKTRGRGLIDFSDCRFERPANFRRAKFHTHFPIFDGAIVPSQTVFSLEKSFWPTQVDSFSYARDSCSFLRNHFKQQGLTEGDRYFSKQELHYAGRASSPVVWIFFFLYRVISDYGDSIWRPIVCLGLLWGSVLPSFVGCGFIELECLLKVPPNPLMYPSEAAGLSGANVFKFFGFQEAFFLETLEKINEHPGQLELLSAAQTVIGYILLFFLGLGLRSRFRLR